MREIKFRGIRKSNNEWIYGYIFKSENRWYLTLPHPDTKYRDVEIIPESLGQFTGLKDKNGKEIYEGDIIVGGANNTGSKIIVGPLEEGILEEGIYHCFYDDEDFFDPSKYTEVVGNIYENKELLK